MKICFIVIVIQNTICCVEQMFDNGEIKRSSDGND